MDKLVTIYDVKKVLKQYGCTIYTGDQLADLDLMADECQELYEWQMIDKEMYMKAMLLIRQERNRVTSNA